MVLWKLVIKITLRQEILIILITGDPYNERDLETSVFWKEFSTMSFNIYVVSIINSTVPFWHFDPYSELIFITMILITSFYSTVIELRNRRVLKNHSQKIRANEWKLISNCPLFRRLSLALVGVALVLLKSKAIIHKPFEVVFLSIIVLIGKTRASLWPFNL